MASKGVNKVILVGNLGQDPETRFLPSGGAVTNITIATSESWKDKTSGQQQERTEWHRICFFNKLAEIAGEYLRKGSKVYIEGSLRTRKWQDKEGQDRYTTEIIANNMQMLDRRPDSAASQQGGQTNAAPSGSTKQYAPQQQAPQQQQNQQPQSAQPQNQQAAPGGYDDFDDDIPF